MKRREGSRDGEKLKFIQSKGGNLANKPASRREEVDWKKRGKEDEVDG
jgi:hypothetical protein